MMIALESPCQELSNDTIFVSISLILQKSILQSFKMGLKRLQKKHIIRSISAKFNYQENDMKTILLIYINRFPVFWRVQWY